MSNIFARLLEEGTQQQQQLKHLETSDAHPSASKTEIHKDSKPPRQHDSTTASRHDSVIPRQLDTMTARQQQDLENYLRAFLDPKPTNKTTLRYPPSLMNELDEIIYQIKKTHGLALSKNGIFILALAYVLFDFRRKASQSLILQMFMETEK